MSNRFAQELKRQGLSVMDVSRATGLRPKYLYHLRNGDRKNPSWAFVLLLSRALHVRPEILFPYAR